MHITLSVILLTVRGLVECAETERRLERGAKLSAGGHFLITL